VLCLLSAGFEFFLSGPVIFSKDSRHTRELLPEPCEIQEVFDLLLLGIDIGGTKLALSLGTADGEIVERFRRPTEATGDPERDIARIADDARALLANAGVAWDRVAAIGISAPGPVDVSRGELVDPPNLPGWGRVPLVAQVEAELGGPVALENDANAAALAEWRFGAGRGFRHVVYLTMSTGVGGGLILDGRLYRGHRGNAGEFGHVALVAGGAACACGLRGCFEAYAGGAAWTKHLRRVVPDAGAVAERAGGRAGVTPEHLVAAARAGDAFALEEFARWREYVAQGIAVVAFALAPERIVLGTIAVAAGEALCFQPLRERVRELVWPEIASGLEIVPAALGADLADLAGICAALEAVRAAG
jgi:glucokinase